MPTQEERLRIVEYDLKQYKTETIKAYSEMAMELVMVKGLTEDAVKRLASLKTQMEQQFEQVDTRLGGMDAHLESIDTSLDAVETRIGGMDSRLETMGIRIGGMDSRLDRVENVLVQILERLPEKP